MTEMTPRLSIPALLILLFLLSCTSALASQVVLKNGDKITGSVAASGQDGLTIKSALIGDVKIPWKAVERAKIDEKVFIPAELRGNKRVADPAPSLNPPKPDGAKALAQTPPPAGLDLFRHWTGSIDPGFTLTEGNANNRTVNIGVNAIHTVGTKKVQFSMNWLHTNTLAGAQDVTTAKALRSLSRYDYGLTKNVFAFGLGNWEYDRFQQLDLRNVMGSGLGWHAVQRKTFRMDLLSGGNFNREKFSTGYKRNYLEAMLDEDATYHPNDHFSLRTHIMVVPNLTLPGRFRSVVESTAVMGITKTIGYQVTLTDRYTSLNRPGVKPNDMVVTTGFHVAFAKK
jgi:putative salt-induced outer membrane protein YdiY